MERLCSIWHNSKRSKGELREDRQTLHDTGYGRVGYRRQTVHELNEERKNIEAEWDGKESRSVGEKKRI